MNHWLKNTKNSSRDGKFNWTKTFAKQLAKKPPFLLTIEKESLKSTNF